MHESNTQRLWGVVANRSALAGAITSSGVPVTLGMRDTASLGGGVAYLVYFRAAFLRSAYLFVAALMQVRHFRLGFVQLVSM